MDKITKVKQYLDRGDKTALRNFLQKFHPADIAFMFQGLEFEEKLSLLTLLNFEKAGSVLDELDPGERSEILSSLKPEILSNIAQAIPSDEAADILSEVSEEKAEKTLGLMEKGEAEDVEELMKYSPETAGGIMTPEFFSLSGETTVDDAIIALRAEKNVEMLSYLYVVDEGEKLCGVVSLKRLITAQGNCLLKEIINRDVISAETSVDQEEIARLVRKYDLRALPIVDNRGRLAGRVTVDDVLDVIEEEATEDIYKMVGTDDEELSRKSILNVARLRLPWLLISLVGGIISARIMKGFNITLENVIALVFFVPVIMGMGGNIGMQSSTIVVRGLATGRIELGHVWRVLFREVRTGIIMGLICGAVVGVVAYIFQGKLVLGAVVASSMFIAITVAAAVGALMPLFLRSLKIDPAIASGPFVTTANDMTGLLIYLFLATSFVKYFG
jgi:magnesium transporter